MWLDGMQVIDAVGCNDSSALRQAQLWYDEARSDTNMIMLDRCGAVDLASPGDLYCMSVTHSFKVEGDLVVAEC